MNGGLRMAGSRRPNKTQGRFTTGRAASKRTLRVGADASGWLTQVKKRRCLTGSAQELHFLIRLFLHACFFTMEKRMESAQENLSMPNSAASSIVASVSQNQEAAMPLLSENNESKPKKKCRCESCDRCPNKQKKEDSDR